MKPPRRKSGRNYRFSTFDIPQIQTEEISPVLIELEKISREVGLPETEVRNLAVYNGLRRQPGGGYDEAALLKMLVRHLREKLYGCAAGD